jgi:hypothetical protein
MASKKRRKTEAMEKWQPKRQEDGILQFSAVVVDGSVFCHSFHFCLPLKGWPLAFPRFSSTVVSRLG